MTDKHLQAIINHGENLLTIFPLATEKDPVKLCKKLRRLENKAHRLAEDCCNIGDFDSDDKIYESIKASVDKILNFTASGVPVLLNMDPRGYALKIKDEWTRENKVRISKDWGGYGLIAPEIDREGN